MDLQGFSKLSENEMKLTTFCPVQFYLVYDAVMLLFLPPAVKLCSNQPHGKKQTQPLLCTFHFVLHKDSHFTEGVN